MSPLGALGTDRIVQQNMKNKVLCIQNSFVSSFIPVRHRLYNYDRVKTGQLVLADGIIGQTNDINERVEYGLQRDAHDEYDAEHA